MSEGRNYKEHFSAYVPTLCSEMFQIKPYADKPSAFGLSVHSFVSYERIDKWDENRYRKSGRKPYFIRALKKSDSLLKELGFFRGFMMPLFLKSIS